MCNTCILNPLFNHSAVLSPSPVHISALRTTAGGTRAPPQSCWVPSVRRLDGCRPAASLSVRPRCSRRPTAESAAPPAIRPLMKERAGGRSEPPLQPARRSLIRMPAGVGRPGRPEQRARGGGGGARGGNWRAGHSVRMARYIVHWAGSGNGAGGRGGEEEEGGGEGDRKPTGKKSNDRVFRAHRDIFSKKQMLWQPTSTKCEPFPSMTNDLGAHAHSSSKCL